MEDELKDILRLILSDLEGGKCSIARVKADGKGVTEFTVEESVEQDDDNDEIINAIAWFLYKDLEKALEKIGDIVNSEGAKGVRLLNEFFADICAAGKKNYQLQVIEK